MENPTYTYLSLPYHEEHHKEQRCTLVVINMYERILPIYCPNCCTQTSNYLQDVEDEFAEFIDYNFPRFPQITVVELADILTTSILQPYIRDHRCPPSDGLVDIFVIEIVREEDAPLMMIPVSESWLKFEVMNKVKEAEDDLGGWNAADHECVICFESIPKRIDSLTLPCSHVFHQDCIVRWLKTSHLCPLCRHAMPTDG